MSRILLLALLLAFPALGQQQSPPPDTTTPQVDNPQTSGAKKVLRRAAPNCIDIFGREDCWSASERQRESDKQSQEQQPPVPQNAPVPRSQNANESSSKETKIDLSAPGEGAPSDVQELHPYDPHRAEKNVEIGDFYFKRQNYVAAESRYAEALQWKPNDAIATFRLAEAQEKLGKLGQARQNYQGYLKILPRGEFAPQAQKALMRLDLKMQSREAAPISPPAQTRQ